MRRAKSCAKCQKRPSDRPNAGSEATQTRRDSFQPGLDSIAERFIGAHVDAIVGVEARGFIFGGALAARLNASFVPARRAAKLDPLVALRSS